MKQTPIHIAPLPYDLALVEGGADKGDCFTFWVSKQHCDLDRLNIKHAEIDGSTINLHTDGVIHLLQDVDHAIIESLNAAKEIVLINLCQVAHQTPKAFKVAL